jgi:hypothetical protein
VRSHIAVDDLWAYYDAVPGDGLVLDIVAAQQNL